MPPRYYTGPISDHFDRVRFFDPHGASVAAPYLDQARLQQREMDKGDRGDQRFPQTYWSKRGENWYAGI
jgi:hypothetical protein